MITVMKEAAAASQLEAASRLQSLTWLISLVEAKGEAVIIIGCVRVSVHVLTYPFVTNIVELFCRGSTVLVPLSKIPIESRAGPIIFNDNEKNSPTSSQIQLLLTKDEPYVVITGWE